MYLTVIVSEIMVMLGIVLITASIASARRLNRNLPDELRGRWQLMTAFMVFFDVAYILFVFMLITEPYVPMELLIGSILLGGAIFVFMFVKLSELTFSRTKKLRQEATLASSQLQESNTVLAEEIWEHEKVSVELHKSKAHIENIFNNSIPLCLTNSNLEIIDANEVYYQIFGRPTDGRLQKCYDSRPGSTCGTEECPLALVLGGAPEVICEARKKSPDGIEHQYMVTARPFINENGKVSGIIESFQDITKLKLAEEAVVAEKERLLVTLKSIADGVITVDINGQVDLINDTATVLTGWGQEDAVGRKLPEVLRLADSQDQHWPVELVEQVLQLAEGEEVAGQAILISRLGNEHYVNYSASAINDRRGDIIGVALVFQDVTEKLRVEGEANRIRRLESFGLLAGGVAHDFNNILTAIMNNLSLARLSIDSPEKLLKKIDSTEEAVLRARDLTEQLLVFAKGGSPVKELVAIGDLVKNSVAFCLQGPRVRSEISLGDGLWQVKADATQLNQVICNLAINAEQAMPEGGVVSFSLENCTVGPNDLDFVKEGDYVKITVRDQGHGMSEDCISRIFDPYFTTKPEGSGLGLATVYAIVARHDGYILAESESGLGAEFIIYLPASQGQTEGGGANQGQAESEQGGAGGEIWQDMGVGKRILIMDDEEDIRDLLGELLKVAGFEVVAVCDGEEALRVYGASMEAENGFDCVIMDLTIPNGMGGEKTIGEMLKMDPDVRAVVSTGYSNDPVMLEYQDYGFVGRIAKPYRLSVLLETLAASAKE